MKSEKKHMTKRSKPSVIIDTNLLISAIIVKGDNTPNKLLELWRKDRYLLCLSDVLLLEIKQQYLN
ncbi:MAG TPA: hypothetical protein VND99_03860 [Candidatus Acidoferrales bacterium]|nr:hypothetical protein [Candidatus Acidoferrales bacterium]